MTALLSDVVRADRSTTDFGLEKFNLPSLAIVEMAAGLVATPYYAANEYGR